MKKGLRLFKKEPMLSWGVIRKFGDGMAFRGHAVSDFTIFLPKCIVKGKYETSTMHLHSYFLLVLLLKRPGQPIIIAVHINCIFSS